MNKENLENALDLCYELEALIEISLHREPLPPRIAELIAEKTEAMRRCLLLANTPASEEERREKEREDRDKEDSVDSVDSVGSEDSEISEQERGERDKEEEEKEEIEETEEIRPSSPVSRPESLGKLFSLNDKFRFRRELFANSAEDFIDSLNLVEAMHSLEEAEDYFYDDLQWERDNEDVVAFMEKIARYFGTQTEA